MDLTEEIKNLKTVYNASILAAIVDTTVLYTATHYSVLEDEQIREVVRQATEQIIDELYHVYHASTNNEEECSKTMNELYTHIKHTSAESNKRKRTE